MQDLFQWWFVKKCAPGGRLVIVPRSLPIFFIIPSFFTQFHFFKKIHFVANNTISAKFSCLDNLRIILLSQVSS